MKHIVVAHCKMFSPFLERESNFHFNVVKSFLVELNVVLVSDYFQYVLNDN